MTLIANPFNVAGIVAALVEQLKDWPGLANMNTQVERSESFNEVPASCPWVCIYRESVSFISKTVGFGTGYRDQQISLVIAAQEADAVSGAACEDRLEKLVQEILSAVLTDTTIRGTARSVEDISIRYAEYRKLGESFMQTAAISLTIVAPVQVTDQ